MKAMLSECASDICLIVENTEIPEDAEVLSEENYLVEVMLICLHHVHSDWVSHTPPLDGPRKLF
jgi:hypothetical protein